MKKTGFTLAEVLITLSIIGVVAMMTLPALMTNVQEQQAKTGIKKGINTLTEAAQMSNAIAGFDYSSCASTSTAEDAQSIFGLLRSRTQLDLIKSNVSFTSGTGSGAGTGVTANSYSNRVLTGDATTSDTNYTVMFFRDGSALAFKLSEVKDASTKYTDTVAGSNNSEELGFIAYYDINGEKAPNVLSNCKGGTASTPVSASNSKHITGQSSSDISNIDASTCNDKKDRVIKDQFKLFLSGANVRPADAAAAWAYYN